MTAAVRKKDEELTINLKCIICVLMTIWFKAVGATGQGV